MLKQIIVQEHARTQVSNGAKQLCKILEETYGPNGKQILQERSNGELMITNSSAAIMQEMKLADLFMDVGVQLTREAIMNTAILAGDGSTLTAVLIHDLLQTAEKLMTAGIHPILLRRELRTCASFCCKQLKSLAENVEVKEQFEELLFHCCKHKEIAAFVQQSFWEVGFDGTILVKEDKYRDSITLSISDGFKINQGPITPAFLKQNNQEEDELVLQHPYILIWKSGISDFKLLLPILEQIVEEKQDLLIVTEEVSKDVLTILLHNMDKKIFRAVVTSMDGIGKKKEDSLMDLATYTGTQCLDTERGDNLTNVKLKSLGRAKEIRIKKDHIIIKEGEYNNEQLTEHIKKIQSKIELVETNEYDKDCHRERIGKLNGKVATIHVGSVVTADRLELKRNVESAIRVGRNMLSSGVVPGAGKALQIVSRRLMEMECTSLERKKAKEMLFSCLQKPYTLLHNGSNFDLQEERSIQDPVVVLITALEQAVSMVYEWMTTEAVMVSVAPDREDMELMKQGVPIMR